MKTQEERLEQLHRRAGELKKKRYRTQTKAWGSLSACLCALLTICILHTGKALHDTAAIDMQGSSLLSDTAGSYVITAVIAFAAGAVITLLIRKSKERADTYRQEGEDEEDENYK